MIPPNVVTGLFSEVQENAAPAVWSKGVTLNRSGCSFLPSKLEEQECVVHLKIAGQPVSPKVTLFPSEKDWDCDCKEGVSPCSHVAAVVIALKRGGLRPGAEITHVDAPDSAPASSSDAPSGKTDALPDAAPNPTAAASTAATSQASRVHYLFRRSPQGLCLSRLIVGPQGRKILEVPLLSYVSGQQSGRIQGPEVMAHQADFQADQVLTNYRGAPLDRHRLEGLFKAFDPDQPLFLDGTPVKFSSLLVTSRYECVDEGRGYRLRILRNPLISEVFKHGVALCTDTLRLMSPVPLSPQEKQWFDGKGSFWPPDKEQMLFERVVPELQKKIPLEIVSAQAPKQMSLVPRVELKLEKDKDFKGNTCLSVLANVVYGDPPVARLDENTLQLKPIADRKGGRMPRIQRQQEVERQLVLKLARELNLQPGRRVLFDGLDAIRFTRQVRSWEFTGDGFEFFDAEARSLEPSVEIRDADGHFSMSVNVAGADNFDAVYKAWERGDEFFSLMDGSWARVPKDWFVKHGKRVRDLMAMRDALKDIPVDRVSEVASFVSDVGGVMPPSFTKLRDLLQDFRKIEDAPLPKDLDATLRSYQRQGVNWLAFVRKTGLGAMLADDMGLGKTLQALCVLGEKSLVVAPTSVLQNWKNEIKKFRPGLKVGLYYGPRRELDTKADVTLTSYGVLRLDQEKLAAINWDTLVIDEAQIIKNPEAQVARAAHALKAQFKISLSGTPVENRLDDLWSQFHFLSPGLLGAREEFLETFARPISSGDMTAAVRLKARIKPFILRRLKKEVAPELPARTELVLRNELTEEERALYDALLIATRGDVMKELTGRGAGSIMKALEAILRLRQACCHQGLIPGQKAENSSKTELLMETLEESLEEGHKSLIFSQWTSYLDRIGQQLKARNIRFSRIDGSTQKRQDIVDEFQGAKGPPIMLISLKAGGVGLNLTAADHVFIMDPWWNPAVEDQAADRAHRIGQQNPVFIHRMVAQDTIEEKILELQAKKKDLAKAVLDEGGGALSLTRDDLMELLS
jgi:hypothetical protein